MGNPNPLTDDLSHIPRKFIRAKDALRKMKTDPRTPDSNFSPWTTHPAREVLKMPNRIPQIPAVLR